MKHPGRGRLLILLSAALSALLLLPELPPAPPTPAGKRPFVWNRDSLWKSLEEGFLRYRATGCGTLEPRIAVALSTLDSLTEAAASMTLTPDASILDRMEEATFQLGPMVAACPENVQRYLVRVAQIRSIVKDQSLAWDPEALQTRDRLYRLLYGGRAATEEVMLQLPEGRADSLLRGDDEPSQAPDTSFLDTRVRSGDILVSRGGAPTSALIARGSDYPGNFSHVALLHVDSATHAASVIESHIERGVTVSTLEEYLDDVKLRVMVLRLRADLPALHADPLLPHRAAERAVAGARARHIPYDFAMDHRDTAEFFCSEVVSAAYRAEGVVLWRGLSSISNPGNAAWLAAFGVRHFETQEPSDLEYDPQLRVVAEWRNPQVLFMDHVDNAVIDAMLEGAEAGDRPSYPWYELPAARVAKAWSWLLNRFGLVGPVPEGMPAGAALKNRSLSARHARIRDGVLRRAEAFRDGSGYLPPFWELLAMARRERDAPQ
jgi:hypothetical protein